MKKKKKNKKTQTNVLGGGNFSCRHPKLWEYIKSNVKAFFITGAIVFTISASATTVKILHSRQVRYKNDKSVETAINELYEKVDELGLVAGCKGCTKLEYLESTGSQYIDTGIGHTGNDVKQNMTVSFTKYVSSGEYGLISTWGNGYKYSNLYLNTGKRIRSYWEANMENPVNIELNTKYNIEHIYDLNGSYGEDHIRSLKINDTIISSYFQGKSTPNPNTFKIFSRADLNNKSYMKLYMFKLYIDGNLVRDYIPVLDKKYIPCLFDKVEEKCYYNQGDGKFLYGYNNN